MNGRLALRDMMRGVSTRDYAEGVEGFLRGYGTARSSVSRGFIRASEAKLKELMERDLSKLDLVALFMDGGFCLTSRVAPPPKDPETSRSFFFEILGP